MLSKGKLDIVKVYFSDLKLCKWPENYRRLPIIEDQFGDDFKSLQNKQFTHFRAQKMKTKDKAHFYVVFSCEAFRCP